MKGPLGSILFFCLAIVNLLSEYFEYTVGIYISKPLLMPTLMLLAWLAFPKPLSRFSKLILLALFFSFLGDSLLMLVEVFAQSDLFFLLGLSAFLLGHLFYITAFSAYKSGSTQAVVKTLFIVDTVY